MHEGIIKDPNGSPMGRVELIDVVATGVAIEGDACITPVLKVSPYADNEILEWVLHPLPVTRSTTEQVTVEELADALNTGNYDAAVMMASLVIALLNQTDYKVVKTNAS